MSNKPESVLKFIEHHKTLSVKTPQMEQLALFCDLLCDTESEKEHLSNSFTFWDTAPLFAISQIKMNTIRQEFGNLPLLKHEWDSYEKTFRVTIQAATIIEKNKNGDDVKIDYYPSANEQLLEETLRKMFIRAPLVDGDSCAVRFTLTKLQLEMKKSGHSRTIEDIKKSLEILVASNFAVELEDKTYMQQGNYISSLSRRTRENYIENPESLYEVVFHKYIMDGIKRLRYRQYNCTMAMSYSTQLARWLHKLLIEKYTGANDTNSFSINYSTIFRDSKLLNGYSAEKSAKAHVRSCLNELVIIGVLDKVEQRKTESKDNIYTLTPSKYFIKEIETANTRLAAAKTRKTVKLPPPELQEKSTEMYRDLEIVAERHLDLASVQSAWQDLNKLVPLGAITSEKDYKRRVSVMDELLDRIGANESHRLMPLLDLVTKEVDAYEAKQQTMPEATPAQVLAFLMEEHNLKQTDLA